MRHEKAPRIIDELVEAVEQAFEDPHHDKLNKIILTLQLNMMEIMKAGGGNNFKQPHFEENQCPTGTILLQLTGEEEVINFVNEQLSRN